MLAFLNSFRYAARGVYHCFRERNFRFHVALLSYMIGYLTLYDWFKLTRAEWAALILAASLVLAAEAVNSAIEALVDLASPEQHPLAAKAKDIAASAVLISSLGAVAVGGMILYQPEAFRQLYVYYKGHPFMLLALVMSLVLTSLVIWGPKNKKLTMHNP